MDLDEDIEFIGAEADESIKLKKNKAPKYSPKEIFINLKYCSIFNLVKAKNQLNFKSDKYDSIGTKFNRQFKRVILKLSNDYKPQLDLCKSNTISLQDYKVFLSQYNSQLDLFVKHLIDYVTNNESKELTLEELNKDWLNYIDKNSSLKKALDEIEKFREANKYKFLIEQQNQQLNSTTDSIESYENVLSPIKQQNQQLNSTKKRPNEEKKISVKRIKIEDFNEICNDQKFELIKDQLVETIINTNSKMFSSMSINFINEICKLDKLSKENTNKDDNNNDETCEFKSQYDCTYCDWKINLKSLQRPHDQLKAHVDRTHLVFQSCYLIKADKDSIFFNFLYHPYLCPDDCTRALFLKYSENDNLILSSFYSKLLNRYIPEIVHNFLIKYGIYTSASKLVNDLNSDQEFGYGELTDGKRYSIIKIIDYLIKEENKLTAGKKLSFNYERFKDLDQVVNFLDFTKSLKYAGSASIQIHNKNSNYKIDQRYKSQSLSNCELLRIISNQNSTLNLSRFFESITIKILNLKLSQSTLNKVNGHNLNSILITPKTYVLIGIRLLANSFLVYESLAGENYNETYQNILNYNENFINLQDFEENVFE